MKCGNYVNLCGNPIKKGRRYCSRACANTATFTGKTHPRWRKLNQQKLFRTERQRLINSKAQRIAYHRPKRFSIDTIRNNRRWSCKNSDGLPFSKSDFIVALKSQHGKCGFPGCNTLQSNSTRAFCVDHDHVTGIFRALLCGPCNQHKVSNHTQTSAQNLIDYLRSNL